MAAQSQAATASPLPATAPRGGNGGSGSGGSRSGPSAVGKAYLVVYNGVLAVAWGALLYVVAAGAGAGGSPKGINTAAARFARLPQLAALMEVIHAMIGLVPSSPLMALTQWGGKAHALFAILYGVPQVQSSWMGPVMLAVWALSEVIRYPWYALTTVGACPSYLTWLRYTMFIPLYPIGVACEMGLIWLSLHVVEADGRWSIHMPNQANFAFDYAMFLKVLLLVYPFVWWQLFSSLLRTRAKKLAKAKSD